MIIYTIGNLYNYPMKKQHFKLSKVNGYMFIFDCGHRVTDNVFFDLIDSSTGIQVCENKQLNIF